MAAHRRWQEFSRTTKVLIVSGAVVEGAAKVAALVDLSRRPQEQVRGRKALWAAAIVLVNAFGAAPAAYVRFGRRRP
ncbi:MAG: hypothetical protein ACTHOD_19705 [Motilibacteraceae bacterium]